MTIPMGSNFEAPDAPGADNGARTVVEKDEQGVSQGRLILRRFVTHKPALVSIVIFLLVVGFALSVPLWWQWDYKSLNPVVDGGKPSLTLWPFSLGTHPFGQNNVGKDYFAMVMRGIVNSAYIMFIIGGIATAIGVVVGAIAGYYRGWVDGVLMRITDIVIVIPVIVIGAVVGSAVGGLGPLILAIFLGFFAWTGIARLVRAEFLSLREREFVEAARVAGASDARIIFRHILPNAIGVVIVSATLLIAAAIILETSLSFLGYGVRSPEVSLGLLISDNLSAFQTRPWLFWWPAVFIVLLSLLVNFVGDGLRDAFDPRQKRIRFKKVKELPGDAVVEGSATSDVPEGPIMSASGTATSAGVSSAEPDDAQSRGGI